MKSKVMERLDEAIRTLDYDDFNATEVKDEIRAAIKEFAEMAEVMSMADSVDGEWNTDHVDYVKQALAAFGVEGE